VRQRNRRLSPVEEIEREIEMPTKLVNFWPLNHQHWPSISTISGISMALLEMRRGAATEECRGARMSVFLRESPAGVNSGRYEIRPSGNEAAVSLAAVKPRPPRVCEGKIGRLLR